MKKGGWPETYSSPGMGSPGGGCGEGLVKLAHRNLRLFFMTAFT